MNVQTTEYPARPAYRTKWLFHRKENQLFGLSNASVRTFYQYDDDQVLASLRCIIRDNAASASSVGPYGCMELEPGANPHQFLTYILNELDSRGIRQLSLTLFPEIYDRESFDFQQQTLQQLGFKREATLSHLFIPISVEENEHLANNDWRSVANTISEFRVSQEPLDQYEKILKLLDRNLSDQGASLDTGAVQKYRMIYPEGTMLFAVRDGARFCAMAAVTKMGPDIIYLHELYQLEEYVDRAPLIALFQFLYEWSELNGIRLIDLGEVPFNLQHRIGTVQGTGERWVYKWS